MQSDRPAIILKLDDMYYAKAEPTGIPAGWQRCIDFLGELGLHGTAGVIGHSLEDDTPAYFDSLKSLHAGGMIELWNHGHYPRSRADPLGEFERPFEDQLRSLMRTQQLGKEKLGICFTAFGPHWSTVNEDTDAAMARVPEIQIWFDGPSNPKGGQLVLKQSVTMELPDIFAPQYDTVMSRYKQLRSSHPYFLVQGHPPHWKDEHFAEFRKIVRALHDDGCVFMTPTEYRLHQS